MLRDRTVRLLLTLSIALGATLGAAAASAQQLEWDQEKVAKLMRELTNTVRQIRNAHRAEPTAGQTGQGNARANQQWGDTLRHIDRSSRNLASRLEQGDGHDQTLAAARRLDMLIRDATVLARRLDVPQATQAHIAPAVALIEQIRPYYAAAPEGGADAEAQADDDEPSQPGGDDAAE